MSRLIRRSLLSCLFFAASVFALGCGSESPAPPNAAAPDAVAPDTIAQSNAADEAASNSDPRTIIKKDAVIVTEGKIPEKYTQPKPKREPAKQPEQPVDPAQPDDEKQPAVAEAADAAGDDAEPLPESWITYETKPGGFSLRLPARPDLIEEAPTRGMIASGKPGSGYACEYEDRPELYELTPEQLKQQLPDLFAAQAKKMDATVQLANLVEVDGRPALDFSIRNERGEITGRYFIAGGRMFLIAYMRTPDKPMPLGRSFVESFKFIGEPSLSEKSKPLPAAKTVEIKQSTPQEAVVSYRDAMINRDWKGAFSVVTPESQLGMLRMAFHNLSYMELSGTTSAEHEKQMDEQREFFKKYNVKRDNATDSQLKAISDPAACYDEIMKYLEANADIGKSMAAMWEGIDPTQPKKVHESGNNAFVVLDRSSNPGKGPPGKGPVPPKYYVLMRGTGGWGIDLKQSDIATQTAAAEAGGPPPTIGPSTTPSPQGDAPAGATSAALRFSLEGHNGFVNAVCFSPDGKTLASGGSGNQLRAWNPANGKSKVSNDKAEGAVECLAYSPDGKQLVVGEGQFDQVGLRLYDPMTLKPVKQISVPGGSIGAVCWSADGNRIYAALKFPKDGKPPIFIINAESGEIEKELYDEGLNDKVNVNRLALSHDGKLLASAHEEPEVRIWDAASGAYLYSLKAKDGWMRGVAFSPDDRQIVTGDSIHTIRVWDLETKAEIKKLTGHVEWSWIIDVTFSPTNPNLLASAGSDKTVRLWDYTTGQQIAQFDGHTDFVNKIAFSPNGKLLASASQDKTVKLWNIVGNPGDAAQASEKKPASNTKPKPSAEDGTANVRTWKSADGKFTVEAELLRVEAGKVHLKRTTGKVIQVPLEKLSPADQDFIKSQQ